MSHRLRLALASLALAASLAAGAPWVEAAPRGLEPDLMDRLAGILERAWSILLSPENPTGLWEKEGPCADPHGQPNPSCTPRPAMTGDRTAEGPSPNG